MKDIRPLQQELLDNFQRSLDTVEERLAQRTYSPAEKNAIRYEFLSQVRQDYETRVAHESQRVRDMVAPLLQIVRRMLEDLDHAAS